MRDRKLPGMSTPREASFFNDLVRAIAQQQKASSKNGRARRRSRLVHRGLGYTKPRTTKSQVRIDMRKATHKGQRAQAHQARHRRQRHHANALSK